MPENRRRPDSGVLDSLLKGASQAMFCENRITGALILAGIAMGGWATNRTAAFPYAVCGLLVSTFTGAWLGVSRADRVKGFCGYNGCLVGAAMGVSYGADLRVFALVTLAAAFSSVLMVAIDRVMKTWDVPALTMPFVVATWVGLFSLNSFGVNGNGLPNFSSRPDLTCLAWDPSFWVESVFNGMGQVFFLGNLGTGAFFLVGLAFASRWAAGLAVAGSLVGVMVSLGMGARPAEIVGGGFGLNPVLTAIALGCVFNSPSGRAFGQAMLGAIITVLAQSALFQFFNGQYGGQSIPVYNLPFVLVTWIFLLARPDPEGLTEEEEEVTFPSAVG